MIRIEMPYEIKRAAYDHLTTNSVGNRGNGSDGSFIDQVQGIAAEASLKYAITGDMEYATTFSDQHDGGTDLIIRGKKVDLKTRSMRSLAPMKPNYEMTLLDSQLNSFDTEVYLIGCVHKDFNNTDNTFLAVYGYMMKDEVLNLKRVKKGELIPNNGGKIMHEKASGRKLYFGQVNPLTSIDQLK